MENKSSELMYTPIGDKGMYGKIDIGKVTFIFILSGKCKNFVHINKICRVYNKKFTDWCKLDSSKSLMKIASKQLGTKKLYTKFTEAPITGYYVHPILLPHIGLWLDNQAVIDIYLFLEKYNELTNTKLQRAKRHIKSCEKLSKIIEEKCDILNNINLSLEKQLNDITDKYNIVISKNETMANIMRVCIENLGENTKDNNSIESDPENSESEYESSRKSTKKFVRESDEESEPKKNVKKSTKHSEEESESKHESVENSNENSESDYDNESDSDDDVKHSVKIQYEKPDFNKQYVCGLYKKIIADGDFNYYFVTSHESYDTDILDPEYEELFLFTSNNKKYINKCKSAADCLTNSGNLEFKKKNAREGPFRYAWTYNEREMVGYYKSMYRRMHKIMY